jgi:DNA polymerase-3 subunit epsilon/ATP-dependent DNA helicase DinG
MERTYIALDVETTGLEAGVDEIIEIAAVKFQGEQVLETFDQLVRPRHSLPLKITRLTGITDADLADAPRFSAVAPELVRFIKSYPLVGHSISFDLRMLQAQGLRVPQPAYDTFDLATLLMPNAPAYKLSALAESLGIVHEDAHRARSDADVTRQVFLHLLRLIDQIDLQELSEINRLMARVNWTARDLFSEIEREKAKRVFLEATGDGGRETKDGSEIDDDHSSFVVRRSSSDITPLKPTGDARPLDVEAVRQFFAPDGAMGRAFPGYEQRPQQVEMAVAVAQAFNNGDALIVEAGTGTGKSMAYLVPAALYAAQRGERVVVSTNTINLQDQLFFKDIPDLQRIMQGVGGQGSGVGKKTPDPRSPTPDPSEAPFTAALLKGRGNYLCLRRYKHLRRDERMSEDEAKMMLKIQLWMPTTTTGDKAELLLMDRENTAWGRVNVTPETCIGPRCPDFQECYFFQARREAEAAHLVVVNHALMLADLAVEANVLPQYNHLIIDEAHNLEDVATDQLGFSIDQARLLQFLDDLFQSSGPNVSGGLLAELPVHFRESTASQDQAEKATEISRTLGPAVERARTSVYDCFNHLTAFIGREAEVSEYDPRLRLTPKVRQNEAWAGVERAWENLGLQLTTIGEGLGRLESQLNELKDADLLDYDALLLRVQSLKRFVTDVRVNMGHIIFGDSEELITWLTFDRQRDTLTLSAAPLSVAELLQANLFSQKATSVLASATLTVGHDFSFVEQRIGLEQAEELQLDSPFDYEKQSFVYIPQDIPEPNQRGYQQALEEALIGLCTATEGHALVLFTANSALRQTYRAIQEPLEEAGITVLGQGIDGSRRAVLQRFKEFPQSVLLGTTSFWEGVDVVGDALSVLIIAKLPFSVPTDPIFAARSEGFTDSFSEFSVPQSILRFKQGFGRLVRSREDRGIVVVLDKRLLTKKYGQTFLNSLPPTLVRTGPIKQLPGLAKRFLAFGNGGGEGVKG